jgi:hypothetical protein
LPDESVAYDHFIVTERLVLNDLQVAHTGIGILRMDSFLKVALRDYVVGLTIFDIELQRLQD